MELEIRACVPGDIIALSGPHHLIAQIGQLFQILVRGVIHRQLGRGHLVDHTEFQ